MHKTLPLLRQASAGQAVGAIGFLDSDSELSSALLARAPYSGSSKTVARVNGECSGSWRFLRLFAAMK
jgi:hypothetical protein